MNCGRKEKCDSCGEHRHFDSKSRSNQSTNILVLRAIIQHLECGELAEHVDVSVSGGANKSSWQSNLKHNYTDDITYVSHRRHDESGGINATGPSLGSTRKAQPLEDQHPKHRHSGCL
jgi:hypothetical protein